MAITEIGFSPKLLTIYVVDAQGKRVNTASLPVTNDGTFGLADPFISKPKSFLEALLRGYSRIL